MALPSFMILSSEQKTLVEGHLREMGPIFEMTPENADQFAEATLTVVSKMIVTLAGRETGELGGEAKGEAFMAALDDVPSWAVQEASRRWYRGECGQDHDYKWMPDPATLRKLAQTEMFRVKGVQRQLADLLAAEPLVEFSKDHEAAMREKIQIPNFQRL